MTTYLGDKAVGIGTVKAEIGVTGIVLHDETLVGNGNTEPLGVNTANIVSQQTLANTVSILNNDIQKTFENSVKKSGDTMTGILTIQAEEDYDPSTPPVGGLSFKSNASPESFTNRMRQVGNGFIAIEYLLNGKQYSNLVFGDQEIYIDNTENGTGNPVSLGTSGNPWDNVYAKKLNNGADITIPTLGGTLARIEDLETKQDKLKAGDGISIVDNVISATTAKSEWGKITGELSAQTDLQDALGTKQDKLTAGDGISIENNVISNTRTNAEWGNITGDLNNQTDLQDALDAKQDKLTAGANIRIEDNVISSTAQESFFRGRFATWTSVPTSSADYTVDFHGNTTPSYNDYIVVEDASLYIPQDFASDPNNVMIRNLHSAGVGYTIEVVIQDQIRRIYYTECTGGVYAQINDWLSVTYMGGAPGVWYIKTNKEFYINNVFTPTANKLLLLKTNTPYETNFYLSEKPGVAPLPIYGSWRFIYHGVWADDNILGWKPEYQVEDTLPMATDTQAGIAKLYKTSGSNTDGAMTQKAVGDAINTRTRVIIRRWN